MAAPSTSYATAPQLKHDVFLSFRGTDTRDNFTSHLYAALCHKKIDTFIDDELIRGDKISPSLLNAIEGSSISVVIFSQGYASSRWCLEELVKILDCKDRYGQIVIPVFYHVDPSNVRNQTGNFGDGFAKLEERYKDIIDILQTWRAALREAANLSGFDSNVIRPESLLIENIVTDILKKLNDESTPIDNKDLVGVDLRIEDINRLLCIGAVGVRKVGIWGIGGIGKTTLAGVVFNKICRFFESSYFIQNIREESEKGMGLNGLRQELLSTILEDRSPNIGFTFTTKRLRRKKVLIVFDDVTYFEQIEYLIGDLDCFGLGSRIIITTRNRQVLENCRVDYIYEVQRLSAYESLQLFSRYAFQLKRPKKDFMKLSSKVVTYAGGNPLALKILGSFLFGRTKEGWESAINKLAKVSHMDIQKVLKVSYDGLDDDEKSIFLDIACFFKGWDIGLVKDILDACDFEAEIGINVLTEKSLITISSNIITMHDLIQEMGRAIVRQESINDPGKRSRLWHHEDIYRVLTKNKGTEAILGICFDISKVGGINIHPNTFSKMENLRFLKIYGSRNNNKVYGFESTEFDFFELRYLYWYGYRAKSLPSNFKPENLVALDMRYSNVEQLWTGVQNLVNLKHIDLSYSKRLLRIPDLSLAANLESLILERCTSLLEIILSAIHSPNKLVILNLRDCRSFYCLPVGICSNSLREFVLSGCSNLKTVPYIPSEIRELYLDGTAIRELPPSIENLSRLRELCLKNCSRLESLPSKICELKSLAYLNLSGCSSLKMIPKMSCEIRQLRLDRTGIRELPPSIELLSQLELLSLENCSSLESLSSGICKAKSLKTLSLSGCSQLDRLPEDLGNLGALRELKAAGTAIREVPASITCLKHLEILSFERCRLKEPLCFLLLPLVGLKKLTKLDLTDCCLKGMPNSLGQFSSLLYLYLGRNHFESLPASMKDLSNLYYLDINNCERLKSLPELPPELRHIEAQGCTSLEDLSGLPIARSRMTVNFINCMKLDWNPFRYLKDALLKIKRNAEASLRDYGNWRFGRSSSMCFPGSEIPKCFSFQNTGSFIELPPGWFKDNLVGLVLCAVVSFCDYQRALDLNISFTLIVNHEEVYGSHLFCWDSHPNETEYIESDHVFVGYAYDMYTTKYHNNEAFIQFFVEDQYRESIEWCKVKKCGVLLLNVPDSSEEMTGEFALKTT